VSCRGLSSTDREISSCCSSEVEIKHHHVVDVNTVLCLVDTQFTPTLGSAFLKLCFYFTVKRKYKTPSRTALLHNVKPNLCNNQTEDEGRKNCACYFLVTVRNSGVKYASVFAGIEAPTNCR
jgi:hypothetical protein